MSVLRNNVECHLMTWQRDERKRDGSQISFYVRTSNKSLKVGDEIQGAGDSSTYVSSYKIEELKERRKAALSGWDNVVAVISYSRVAV